MKRGYGLWVNSRFGAWAVKELAAVAYRRVSFVRRDKTGRIKTKGRYLPSCRFLLAVVSSSFVHLEIIQMQ